MKHHTLCIGLASMLLAASALAQTASPDNSRGAQEQQSQRKPCTSDSSNVNCKPKTTNGGDTGGTTR